MMKTVPKNDSYPELLAPAGNFEKLRYALAFGANAVYAGQPQFSLRARDNGFKSLEDIEAAIQYTQSQGARFFLTSNIIPHNNKVEPFQRSLAAYCELKPDALIVTDPGVIAFVRHNFPQQELHLSVQANCTNWATARFWHDQGIRRVILSRELNLREIREIHEHVPELELEVFVHGAVCMAHSGRCLLSNYMSYRDSNQGMCSNACRFPYRLYANNQPQSEDYTPLEGSFYLATDEGHDRGFIPVDEDEYGTYIMNSKDLCAIEHVEELREAGVISFKIEGRTKSLYYLAQAVKTYRSALDDAYRGIPFRPILREELDKLDSRGYMPGYFGSIRHNPQNQTSASVPATDAQVAAFVRGFEQGQAVVSVRGQIKEGDPLEVVAPQLQQHTIASGLIGHRGEAVPTLNPGLENCRLALENDPGEFAFLINRRDRKPMGALS